MNDLEFSLGLNIAGFEADAKKVAAHTGDIKRGFMSLRDVLSVGGVATAVIGFFRASISYAESLNGATDENILAAQRLGTAYKEAGEKTLETGAKAAGAFGQLSELLGKVIATGREAIPALFTGGIKGFEEAADRVRARIQIAEAAQRGANEQAAALYRLDKTRGAELRQQKQENLRDAERLAKAERDYSLSRLTEQERVNALTNEYLNAQNAIAISNGGALEKQHLANKAREIGLELLKAQDSLQKSTNEKITDAFKEWDEAAKKEAADREKLQALRLEAGTAQERVNALTMEEGKLADTITALKLKGLDTTKEEIDLLETRKAKAQAVLDLEDAIAKAKKAALAATVAEITARENQGLKHAGETVIDEIHGVAVGRARSKDQFSGISDQVLAEVIRRNQERIDLITARQGHGLAANPGIQSGFFAEGQAIYQIAQDSANARAVLNQRRQLRSAPYDQALRNYEGDPLNFDRLYQEALGARTEQTQLLTDIKKRLDTGIRTIPLGGN